MDKKQIILNYVAENPDPKPEVAPIIIQYAGIKKGHKHWRSDTGEIVTNSCFELTEDEKARVLSVRVNQYGYYATYTCFEPELEMIEISLIFMDGKTGRQNVARPWSYNDKYNWRTAENTRHFLFRDSQEMYNIHGEPICDTQNGLYYNKETLQFGKLLDKYSCSIRNKEELLKFIKSADCNIEHIDDYTSNSVSFEYLIKNMFKRKISTHTKDMKEICKLPLTPLSELSERYKLSYHTETKEVYDYIMTSVGMRWGNVTKEVRIYDEKTVHKVHFEIINDDYCVLRMLKRETDAGGGWKYPIYKDSFSEDWRVYIDTKGKATLCENIYDWDQTAPRKAFKISSRRIDSLGYILGNFENMDEIKNWPRLSWIKDIVNEIELNPIISIVAMLRHPIVELTYKAGYHNLALYMLNDNTVAKNVEAMFGVKEKKKGKLTTILNCNKFVLKYMDSCIVRDGCDKVKRANVGRVRFEMRSEAIELLRAAKLIFGLSDLQHVNQDFVDKNFPGVLKLISCRSGWLYYLKLDDTIPYRPWYRRNYTDLPGTLSEEEQRAAQHMIHIGAKNPRMVELIYDTIDSWYSIHMGERPELGTDVYKPKTIEEAQQLHDMVTGLLTQQQARDRAAWDEREKKRREDIEKSFKKNQKDRIDKYEYTTPEAQYVIKMPESTLDIINEGNRLHHCVGGYADRHALGETNIIFLRDKSNPTISLFTIEVKNNIVVQIHGSHNRWLGNNVEKEGTDRIQFMIDWLKAKGIKCNKNMLLDTGAGYSGNGILVDESKFIW